MSDDIMSPPADADTLVRTLSAVADQVDASNDWDRLVADITEGETNEPGKPVSKRPRLLAAAAALVAIGTGVVALNRTLAPSPTEISTSKPNYVLPGEVVLSEDPLIVAGALGPEPQFDTSDLGREIAFEPVSELDEELTKSIDRVTGFALQAPEAKLTKVTALGKMTDDHWLILISDAPNLDESYGASVDANIRTRSLMSRQGVGSSGDIASIDSLDGIASPTISREGPALGGVGFGAPTGWVQLDTLPAGTSVVSFADSDQRLWIRPVAGVAIFPAQFDEGESFTVSAFDAEGALVGAWSETVRYAADAETTNPQVGEAFGTIQGTNAEGEPMEISPNGNPTILVYGAGWCVPCAQVIENALPALTSLQDTVNVYSVPHYVSGDTPWPTDTAWPYATIHPNPNSPATNVGVLPTVLILDGEHQVVALLDGFDNLAERLEALGIAPGP